MVQTRYRSVLLFAVIASVAPQLPGCKHKKQPLYDSKTLVADQMQQAYIKAESHNKLILIVFGADWCSWCMKIHDVIDSNPTISKIIADRYVVVYVENAANAKFARRCKASIKSVPYLTILNSSGKALANQGTEEFEKGDVYDIPKLYAFLSSYSP